MIVSGKNPATALTSLAILLMAGSLPVYAENMRIGFAAPLSGTFAPLGNQLAQGARIAALAKGAELVVSDDHCTAEGGKDAAERFVQQNVQIAAGFLCSEALEAALRVLGKRNIPIIISGISEPTLTEKRTSPAMPTFRLTTGLNKETQATASFLGSLWRAQPFAIIEDGTIEGRERAGHVLASLKAQQLQPVFTDTYRPGLENQNALIARLKRAGASHVYVGGERDDISAIAASAERMNYPLVIAGGSLLDAVPGAVPLAEGTLMTAPLKPQNLPTAKPAIDALKASGDLVDGFAITGYASVEITVSALAQAQERKQPLPDVLRNVSFETALGTIKFDPNGLRTDNPNRLQRYDGKRFIPADR
ncbi:branched-chain amino acid ABC transporter substrate-binding protein [Brucella sp. BE17]|uniref:branched-chain amino acid ABC transporter substrate-binding protein n=1 Tax=Brucella sp. BE17 TaxID=3142977 RepID=UPI0031BB3C16